MRTTTALDTHWIANLLALLQVLEQAEHDKALRGNVEFLRCALVEAHAHIDVAVLGMPRELAAGEARIEVSLEGFCDPHKLGWEDAWHFGCRGPKGGSANLD